MPLEQLPRIDEHYIDVEALTESTYAALFPTLESALGSKFAHSYCERTAPSRPRRTATSTIPAARSPASP